MKLVHPSIAKPQDDALLEQQVQEWRLIEDEIARRGDRIDALKADIDKIGEEILAELGLAELGMWHRGIHRRSERLREEGTEAEDRGVKSEAGS